MWHQSCWEAWEGKIYAQHLRRQIVCMCDIRVVEKHESVRPMRLAKAYKFHDLIINFLCCMLPGLNTIRIMRVHFFCATDWKKSLKLRGKNFWKKSLYGIYSESQHIFTSSSNGLGNPCALMLVVNPLPIFRLSYVVLLNHCLHLGWRVFLHLPWGAHTSA